jgi:uncharacterized protein
MMARRQRALRPRFNELRMLTSDADSTLLAVRVKPRSSRARIAGERAGRLLVEVTAPPVDGRANEAVRRVIAAALGIAPNRVSIDRGAASRDKLLRIEAVEAADVADRLGLRAQP